MHSLRRFSVPRGNPNPVFVTASRGANVVVGGRDCHPARRDRDLYFGDSNLFFEISISFPEVSTSFPEITISFLEITISFREMTISSPEITTSFS